MNMIDYQQLNDECPICGSPVNHLVASDVTYYYHCVRCGEFRVSHLVGALLEHRRSYEKNFTEKVANIAGYIHENPNLLLNTDADEKSLWELKTPSVEEKAIKLLRLFAKESSKLGDRISIYLNKENISPLSGEQIKKHKDEPENKAFIVRTQRIFWLLGNAWAQDEFELLFLIYDYLYKEAGFVSYYENNRGNGVIVISPKGWKYLQGIGNFDEPIGFVAMWFSDEVSDAWEAIESAIQAAGYRPERIDKKQHNNKICDEILASIRRSKFVVADFTGHRGGVYYEAGYAQGLGKPVIWTVEEKDLDDLHFDTQQYNHLKWKKDDLESFKKDLQHRIEATIGKGPEQRTG